MGLLQWVEAGHEAAYAVGAPLIDATADALQRINPAIGDAPTEAALPIPLEYQTWWYLSPRHHAVETWFYICLYCPLFSWLLYKALTHREWRESPPVRSPTRLDLVLGLTGFGTLAVMAYYKVISEGSWRMPYLWQPCHVITLFLSFNAVASSRFSELLFQVAVSLGWSSLFAIIFPDLSDYEYLIDMIGYGVEHIIMLFIPFVLVKTGRFRLQTNWYCIWFGYLCTITYHAFALVPLGLYTHINLATMLVPPPPLAWAGVHYRPAQFCFCALVHAVYNFLVQWCAAPYEEVAPSSSSSSSSAGGKGKGKKKTS